MSKHCNHWICARAVGFSLLVSAGATAALAQSGSLSQSGLVGKLEGAELISDTPQEFTAYIKAQIARFAQVVKATGMRAD